MKTVINGFTAITRYKEHYKWFRKRVLKTLNNTEKEYDATDAPIDWAEHKKVRDLLAVRAAERRTGLKLIERSPGDAKFVSTKSEMELAEEFETKVLNFPYELLGEVDLLSSSEYNPAHINEDPIDAFEQRQIIPGAGSRMGVDEFFKKVGI